MAHLTTWWRRETARLAAAQRGERPSEHPPQREVAVINQWIYLTNRDRPLPNVLRDADEVWQQFEAVLQDTPEHDLFALGRFEWLDGRALGPAIVDDFVLHLREEHEPVIRDWLAHLDDDALQS
ncbi:MAG: ClbS/DfsB family four-helix bundle protein [Chloroflexota bacterium]|nr:ClbS/DfsB family four-helix bundle protein [Chloroflexota bacterium]